MNFLFDLDTLGTTQGSLKMLRNELISRADRPIAVAQVPSDEGGEVVGFLILDDESEEVVYIGDNFRVDECGEGGAGYKTAKALFRIMNVQERQCEPFNYSVMSEIKDEGLGRATMRELLHEYYQENKEDLRAAKRTTIIDSRADYLR